jgi:hypothetical protein
MIIDRTLDLLKNWEVKLMNFHFSEEEISLIKDLIETSYACTLGGKELTYGEKLEKLLSYHG